MKFVLLDIAEISTFWLGFGLTAAVGVISYLFKLSMKNQQDKIKEMDEDIEELKKADRRTNDKINDVILKISTDINAIGIKLAEFKRDLTK